MLTLFFRKCTVTLLLAVLFMCVSGCVAPGADIHHRSFNHRSVQDRGLAIIGVVSSDKNHATYRSAGWSKTLSKSVKKHHDEFPLRSASDTRKAMGAEDYSTVMKSLHQNNELYSRELQLIRKSKIISRYAMVARIESDKLENPPHQRIPMTNGRGEVYRDRVALRLTSKRTVTVSAQIYDLETGLIVWQKTENSSPENVATYTDYNGKSFTSALTAATMNKLANGSLDRKPPVFPDFKSAFGEAIDKLTNSLPKADY